MKIHIFSYSTAIFRGCFKSHWHGDRLGLQTNLACEPNLPG
ncbi:hypothetical protein [Nodularia spumigena]|nr:hypothetical protein [Nodularia spumigena]MDB9317332.1 hypothetical protein [Nodularia spumigena CS-590/01A]